MRARYLAGLRIRRIWHAAELGQDLNNAVQMGQPRTEAVDELIEKEFAFNHVVARVVDLFCHPLEIIDLDACQGLGCFAARTGQGRVGISPLIQLVGSLLLICGQNAAQFLQELVRAILGSQHFSQQFSLLLPRRHYGMRLRVGRSRHVYLRKQRGWWPAGACHNRASPRFVRVY
jgi:hypothetical protein